MASTWDVSGLFVNFYEPPPPLPCTVVITTHHKFSYHQVNGYHAVEHFSSPTARTHVEIAHGRDLKGLCPNAGIVRR